jgi:hypothetical protein
MDHGLRPWGHAKPRRSTDRGRQPLALKILLAVEDFQREKREEEESDEWYSTHDPYPDGYIDKDDDDEDDIGGKHI